MYKKIFSYTMLISLFAMQNVFAGANFQYATSIPTTTNNQSLQGYALYVPAGITLSAILSQEINSKTAVVGQTISAILEEDFIYNGKLIASSGSVISGSVVSTKKAGIADRNAQMQIRFTTIRTPYNNVIPISAVISTKDSSGVLKGGTAKDAAKEYAKDAIIGAGAGAVLGTALGPMSGGSVGKGAIYGTALGGGIGVAKAVATKGEDILIPANSKINLIFDQPITLGTSN